MKTKSLLYTIVSALLIGGGLTFSGCKKEVISPVDNNYNLVEGTWKVRSVTIDGVDHTADFSGLILSFSKDNGFTFASSLDLPFFEATNIYAFSSAAEINLNNIECSLESLTETEFIFAFHWDRTTFGSGRTQSTAGAHRFVFTR